MDSNDYVIQRGELVPIGTYLKLINGEDAYPIHRDELIQAFNQIAPAHKDNVKLYQLLAGIGTVVTLLLIINFLGI
jgi:hypothetical protein